MPGPRPFVLERTDDETGVSGTGIVAEGVQFTDGKAVTRWVDSKVNAVQTCVWDSIADIETVHGHGGKTRIRWTDEPATHDPGVDVWGIERSPADQLAIRVDELERLYLRAVGRLAATVDEPELATEPNGRYILLDALTAIVNARAALHRG